MDFAAPRSTAQTALAQSPDVQQLPTQDNGFGNIKLIQVSNGHYIRRHKEDTDTERQPNQ